jgi:ABC-type multidrug transport system fused ATPase/permease subunit
MFLVVFVASIAMITVAKKVGGASAKNFMKMQKSIAKSEGFVEEMMNGQKVVKVFCHEEQSIEDFDKVNGELCADATAANRFANILMPIMGNIGNILYVLVAFVGGALIINGATNISIQRLVGPMLGMEVGAAVGISVVVPFLNASKQFTNNVSQVSQQINAIVMAMAGASRVFELLDTEPELDEGYVMLVNAKCENGEIVERGDVQEIFRKPKTKAARKLFFPDATERETPTARTAVKNRLRLAFNEQTAYKPIIANMILDIGEPVNMLYANMDALLDEQNGQMVIALSDNKEVAEKQKAYLIKEGVDFKEIPEDSDYYEYPVNGPREEVD